MPGEHKPCPPHRLRGFWFFLLVLLALNWITVLAAQPSGQPRVRIPSSPCGPPAPIGASYPGEELDARNMVALGVVAKCSGRSTRRCAASSRRPTPK